MVPIIITLVFFHGIWDPVRFLALTMETSSTAVFKKPWPGQEGAWRPTPASQWICSEPASAGLCPTVGHSEVRSETTNCSPRLPLWLSWSGRAQFQTCGSGQRHLEAGCAHSLSPRNRQLDPTGLGFRWSCPAPKGPEATGKKLQTERHALP